MEPWISFYVPWPDRVFLLPVFCLCKIKSMYRIECLVFV